MLEDQIESEVCVLASRAGWLHRKLSWQGRRGACDHAFIGHGRFVLIEFKRPGKKIDPQSQQGREFARLKAAYPEVYEVSTVAQARQALGL